MAIYIPSFLLRHFCARFILDLKKKPQQTNEESVLLEITIAC